MTNSKAKKELIKDVLLSIKKDNLTSENSEKLLNILSKAIDDETLANVTREIEISKEVSYSITRFNLSLTCMPKLKLFINIDDMHNIFDVSNIDSLQNILSIDEFPEFYLKRELSFKEAGRLYDKFKCIDSEKLLEIKEKLIFNLTNYNFFKLFTFYYAGGIEHRRNSQLENASFYLHTETTKFKLYI